MAPTGDGEDRAVTLFREYVRIETVQPRPDYDGAIKFLIRYAEELGLPHTTHECAPGKPILVMTWEGTRAFNEPSRSFTVPGEKALTMAFFLWKLPTSAFGIYKDT